MIPNTTKRLRGVMRLGYQNKKILTFAFLSVITLFLVNFTFKLPVVEKVIPFYTTYLTRLQINDKIKVNEALYIKKYGEYFKRNDIAKEVVKAAIELEMPINLCFAIGLAESNLNHLKAPNYNKNGSFDYGVFRLNSSTYPDIKTYSKLENNVRQGILHFKDEYKKYNSFDIAIMTYNSGSIGNIKETSVRHLHRVLGYEKALDEWFNSEYWSSFNRSSNKREI